MTHFHILRTGLPGFDAVEYATWTDAALALCELTSGEIEPCACEAGRLAIEGERAGARPAGAGVYPSGSSTPAGSALDSDPASPSFAGGAS